MTWRTLIAGYAMTFGAIAAYAAVIISRGRRLGRRLGLGTADEQE